jgi:serine/threonine protein kinase
MPFTVPMSVAATQFPEYKFIAPLTPSVQKAAFHVKDTSGNDLCLKIISPDYDIDRLSREIQALQELNHPNVVRLIGYTRSLVAGNQKHYMIEQFIEGCDLSVLLHSGFQNRSDIANLFVGISDGLSALADHNIVHRDLKPSNIRVKPDGTSVIIDFGLARLLTLPDLTPTSQGAAIGTLMYFSPEQCRGNKHNIDHRTDLFALGIMLYEALIGRHPFCIGNMTDSQLRDAICDSEDCFNDPKFVTLPTPWKILVKKLLSKERAIRPLKAHQVSAIFHKIGAV